MQKSQLDNKTKFKILIGSLIAVMLISLPVSFSNFLNGNGLHIGIHIAAITLAAFLSIVGFFTYKEFRTGRLFLVMSAFIVILVAEIVSLSSFLISESPFKATIDSLITHSMILVMLSFFSVGIFRRD